VIAQLRSEIQLGVSSESPDEADEKPFRDILFHPFETEGEVRMLGVVLDDVADSLVDQGEEGVQGSGSGEVHDVFDGLGVDQRGADEIAFLKIPLQDVRNLLLRLQVCGGGGVRGQGVSTTSNNISSIILIGIKRYRSQCREVVLVDHGRVDYILAEPNHAATADSGQSRVSEMFHLEHDADVRRKIEALAIRESEEFVVVQDTESLSVHYLVIVEA